MIDDIGPLRGADESLHHQIVDTFAVVSESDYAWTEKIWTSIASVDGSVQVDFGLGKYHNRGIIDGVRRRVARARAVDGAREPRAAVSAPEDASIGPTQLRDRRAAPADAGPARTERRPADLVRPRALGGDPAVLRGPQPRAQRRGRDAST